jgi:hypothetical protein
MLKIRINAKDLKSNLQALPDRWGQLFGRSSRSRSARALIPEAEVRNLPGLKQDMLRAMGLVDEAARVAPMKKSTSARVVQFFSRAIFRKK